MSADSPSEWGDLRADRAWRHLDVRDDDDDSGVVEKPSSEHEWPTDIEYFADGALTIPGTGDQPESCGCIYPMHFCTGCGEPSYSQSTCELRTCPECWRAWTRRRSETAVARLAAARLSEPDGIRRRTVHAVVSPPPGSVRTMSQLKRYKKKAYRKAEEAGVRGGSVIEHGWRVKDWVKDAAALARQSDEIDFDSGDWAFVREHEKDWSALTYWSPHFHIVGLSTSFEGETDPDSEWVVKRLSTLESMGSGTDVEAYESMVNVYMYVLSHAAIDPQSSRQSVTWFGTLANNKFSPESSLSSGLWNTVQRYAREASAPGGFGGLGEEEESEYWRSEEGECLGGTEGCRGTVDDLEPIWDAGQWMMDGQWTDGIDRESLRRLECAFGWMIGELDPPPDMRYPDSEEEAREALQGLVESR